MLLENFNGRFAWSGFAHCIFFVISLGRCGLDNILLTVTLRAIKKAISWDVLLVYSFKIGSMTILLESIRRTSSHQCMFICGLAPSHLSHKRYALISNHILATLSRADRPPMGWIDFWGGLISCTPAPLRVFLGTLVFQHFQVDISIFSSCGYAFCFFARSGLTCGRSYCLQLVIEIVQILRVNNAMFFLVSHLCQNFLFDTLCPESIESWVCRHN